MSNTIKFYGLSTCIHCKNAKAFLDDCGEKYDCIFVDKLEGGEKKAVMKEIKEANPRMSFPTMIINGDVVVGFNKDKMQDALEKK